MSHRHLILSHVLSTLCLLTLIFPIAAYVQERGREGIDESRFQREELVTTVISESAPPTDASGNSNTLTAQGSPVFTTELPPSGGSSATSSYTYSETNYANPHALTSLVSSLGTTTYSYDALGNLATTTGVSTSTYTWDYRSRLARSWIQGATTTHLYDHTTQRMRHTQGSTTTDYPTLFYSLATSSVTGTGTSTSYLFHADTLIATIDQQMIGNTASGTPTTYYVHPDSLGSTNTVTSSTGTVVHTLSYYPFGQTRITNGRDVSAREYIGQITDPSSLSYLNARFYDSARGQFVSQDPVHLAIGDPNQLKQLVGLEQKQILTDPQLLNSYSYARNNPIVLKDPEGKIAFLPFVGYALLAYSGAQLTVDAYDAYITNIKYPQSFSQAERNQTNFKLGYDATSSRNYL